LLEVEGLRMRNANKQNEAVRFPSRAFLVKTERWRATIRQSVGWFVAIAAFATAVVIVQWGLVAVGLPQNPAETIAPLAAAVADSNNGLDPKDRFALQRDLAEYVIDSRIRSWTLLAQVIGAILLAVGGYFTWRNLRVAQEAQITNRFTQAIGQLGAMKAAEPNLEVRLGGIYALERIARDSPRDHWTIMEVLTAYVRENAPTPEPTSQAADKGVELAGSGKVEQTATVPKVRRP
jgi:hypothetical protein